MLKSGLAPDSADLRDQLTTIYAPEYEAWPEITRKALDCDVVIATVEVLNDGSDSREERKEHSELMKKIYAAHGSRKSDVEFDSSVQHKAWLARLQEVTAEIVELDRNRLGGRYEESSDEEERSFEEEEESEDEGGSSDEEEGEEDSYGGSKPRGIS